MHVTDFGREKDEMKKRIWIWGIICLVAVSACSNKEKEPGYSITDETSYSPTDESNYSSTNEPNYSIMNADWPACFWLCQTGIPDAGQEIPNI